MSRRTRRKDANRCAVCQHELQAWGSRLYCMNAQCPGSPLETDEGDDTTQLNLLAPMSEAQAPCLHDTTRGPQSRTGSNEPRHSRPGAFLPDYLAVCGRPRG